MFSGALTITGYTVTTIGAITVVTDLDSTDGDDGVTTLEEVEILRFTDQDLTPSAPVAPLSAELEFSLPPPLDVEDDIFPIIVELDEEFFESPGAASNEGEAVRMADVVDLDPSAPDPLDLDDLPGKSDEGKDGEPDSDPTRLGSGGFTARSVNPWPIWSIPPIR